MTFKIITSSLSSLLIASSLLTTLPTKAASFQLVEMECRSIAPLRTYHPLLRLRGQKVIIGSQEFDEIASFDNGSYPALITKDQSLFTNCPIASGSNNSRFQSLRLKFGLDNRHERITPTTIVRLSLLLNGQISGYKDIRPGEHINWIVDLKNTNNVGLKAECIEDDGRQRGTSCPPISFTDMALSTSPVSSLSNTNNLAKNTVLLADMSCTKEGGKNSTPLRVVRETPLTSSRNPENFFYINIGRQRVREVAFLSGGYTFMGRKDEMLGKNESIETSCTIPPYFQKLNLVYGIDDEAKKNTQQTIELTVYVNGQFMGKRLVSYGQKPQSWNIPLSNPRTINLEAKCLAKFYCSRLSFTKLSLE